MSHSIAGVFIDSREPTTIRNLEFGGALKSVMKLDAGDLWLSTTDDQWLVVERKTPTDLLASIADGRFLPQMKEMRERSQWTYLVVTGVLTPDYDGKVVTDSRATGWSWESLQGALVAAQEMGVAVVYCRGDGDFQEAICRLAQRHRGEHILEPRYDARFTTPAEQILSSLPGIGLERAQLLLAEFDGIPAQALCWLTWPDTVTEVSGIGHTTKLKVREALALSADEWLQVLDSDTAKVAAQQLQEATQ